MNLPQAVQLTAMVYGLDALWLKSRKRGQYLAQARMAGMKMAREYVQPTPSFADIAAAFGRGDHGTAMHAIRVGIIHPELKAAAVKFNQSLTACTQS